MDSERDQVVDALPGLVWTASSDGTVIFINKRWSEFLGQKPERVMASGWFAAAHPDDRVRLDQSWAAIVKSGQAGEMEGRLRRHDGEYRTFLFRISPGAAQAGRPPVWYGVATDIEERARSFEALRASEAQFRLTVDGLPAIVTLHAPDGNVVYANRRALEFRLTTLPAIQQLPQGFSYHPDDREKFLKRWGQSLATGETYQFEGRRLHGDGSVRWLQTIGYPLRGGDGKIAAWYLIHNDVNDRRIAEARFAGEMKLLELMASGASLPRVLETLCLVFEDICAECTCSVTLVEDDHLLNGASPSLAREFAESINGRPISIENGPCAMAASLNEQVVSEDIGQETRWRAYGWPEWALSFGWKACWSTPIVSRCGNVIGTLGLHYRKPSKPTQLQQDMIAQFAHLASIAIERSHEEEAIRRSETALDKVRSELIRVSRVMSLGALTASIAHEVNQPLAGIITNASTGLRMLSANPPNIEGALETARRTIRDGNRASDVIARLRALFTGKEPAAEVVDLNAAIREVLVLSKSQFERAGVEIQLELDARQPEALGDRVQIQQVIMNLVNNAVDAVANVRDRQRQIVVSTRLDQDGNACVTISDNGTGIDTANVDRIFDAFFTTKGDGMGIGLAVCRSIVEQHHGRIWAARNPIHGSTFSFSMPIAFNGMSEERMADSASQRIDAADGSAG